MRQVEVQKVEIKDLCMNTIVAGFYQGDGIIFVTENGRLVGAVTEGDIKRRFRNGQHTVNETIINHKISYIEECKDSAHTYAKAEEIFKRSSKIHNIPVVDSKGELLYQIIRENDMMFEHVKSCFRVICRGFFGNVFLSSSSLDVFFECHKVEHIVLAGGENRILNWAKEYLTKELQQFGVVSAVNISIAENVFACQEFGEGTLVICTSEVIAYYLRTNFIYFLPVVSLEEMKQYCYYKKLDDIDEDTIADFLELFGYETICICDRNKYINRIIHDIEKCGVHVTGDNKIDATVVNFYQTDLCAFSMNNTLKETLSLQNFYLILEWIQKYRYILHKSITPDEYTKQCVSFMQRQKEEGMEGIVFELNNTLDYHCAEAIKAEVEEFLVMKPGEKMVEEIRLVKDIQNTGNLKEMCICASLVNICYDSLHDYFNNVYVHRPKGKGLYLNPNRSVENYDKNEIYFSSDFITTMYGREDFPLEQFLADMKNCSVVRVNETHLKYQSNYASEFFNTDTYGCRVVENAPKKYIGTIWLLGACIYSGYAVVDSDTTASILQERLNQLGRKYRVVNLSVSGANMWNYMDKIRDSEIRVHDMVVCWVQDAWNRRDDEHVIITDMDEFISQIGDNDYWDNTLHCGRKGYAIIAEHILNKIEPSLISLPERRFQLGDNLEREIAAFVKDMINNVRSITDGGIFYSKKAKFGSIVMNCNPFTYGHQYLIETASRLVDILYVFVVEEDKSVFPFCNRFQMVKEGVQDFSNVVVLPSGKFMISSVTFPGYFMKDNPDGKCYDSFLDLKIFSHYIAPALGISVRFVGEEPFDQVTAQYNLDMKTILGEQKIDVVEIPRKKWNGEVISATKVRELMKTGEYRMLKNYVPDSTIKYL